MPAKTTSERKRQANRRNAQKSTGPKTPAGKARSAQNALKHGFASTKLLFIPEFYRPLYAQLESQLRAELKPTGQLEQQLFAQLLHSAFCLQLLELYELQLLCRPLFHLPGNASTGFDKTNPTTTLSPDSSTDPNPAASTPTSLTSLFSFDKTNPNPASDQPPASPAFLPLANPFLSEVHGPGLDRLHRYRTAHQRNFNRALRELRHQQTLRYQRQAFFKEEAAGISILVPVLEMTRAESARSKRSQTPSTRAAASLLTLLHQLLINTKRASAKRITGQQNLGAPTLINSSDLKSSLLHLLAPIDKTNPNDHTQPASETTEDVEPPEHT